MKIDISSRSDFQRELDIRIAWFEKAVMARRIGQKMVNGLRNGIGLEEDFEILHTFSLSSFGIEHLD